MSENLDKLNSGENAFGTSKESIHEVDHFSKDFPPSNSGSFPLNSSNPDRVIPGVSKEYQDHEINSLTSTSAADASVIDPVEGTVPLNENSLEQDNSDNLQAADNIISTPAAKSRRKSFWREVLETVILTIFIFFLVKSLIQNFRIQGSSMEPNFHTGQLLLVNKASYFHVDSNSWLGIIPGVKTEGTNTIWLLGGPHRGDVIVLEPPDVPLEDYIKRVIGLPGEKIEVRDGVVLINDKPLPETYIKEKPYSPYGPVVVPNNSVFVMGDNRNASRDSRIFGFLPFDKIVGKAMFVYWPFGNQWGAVPDIDYNK